MPFLLKHFKMALDAIIMRSLGSLWVHFVEKQSIVCLSFQIKDRMGACIDIKIKPIATQHDWDDSNGVYI